VRAVGRDALEVCVLRSVAAGLDAVREQGGEAVEALIDVGFSASASKEIKTFKGTGCTACNNTGYKGRIGLYEVMEVSDDLRELILVGASGLELRRKAIEEGMLTLRQSGLEKIRAGMTTVEEVVRETVK